MRNFVLLWRNFGKCNEISPNLRSGGVRNFERRDENFVQNAYEILKGETNLLSKCVRNFVLPERATVSFDVGSVMAALILAYIGLEHKYASIISYFAVFELSLTANSS